MQSSRCTTEMLMRWVPSVSAVCCSCYLSCQPLGAPGCASWLVLLTKRLLSRRVLLIHAC